MPNKSLLIVEFLLLFVALPVAFRMLPCRISPLPALWLASLYCVWTLHRSPQPVNYWNTRLLLHSLPAILGVWLVAAIVITIAVYRWRPQVLFGFVRTNPIFWAIVMVLYPLLSVLPQGIIYRVFIFQRYGPLFGSTAVVIVASAAAFGFSHLIFRSPWSVALTFVAGLLFAFRYAATDSLVVSSLEHALYGCYMFTVGLGGLFYHGAGRVAIAPR